MSLVKAIKAGKEKRRPYYGAKRFDTSCRPHGGCPWCESNRFHSVNLRKLTAEEQLKEWKNGIVYHDTWEEVYNPNDFLDDDEEWDLFFENKKEDDFAEMEDIRA